MFTPEISQPRQSEELLSKDPRVKLRAALPNLSPLDAYFIENVLDSESKDDPLFNKARYTRVLKSFVDLIGDNPQKNKENFEQRKAVERVDLMNVMSSFNSKEQRVIAKNLVGIQMTDGCTVGCPFCGAEAKKGIEKAFTFESYQQFMEKFGKNLPWKVVLYHNSDPFDWVSEDGKYDYTDLTETFFENARENRFLYTSTAVPEGSEIAIVKFLFLSYFRDIDRVRDKLPTDTMFRFSQTKDNADRVHKIMKVLTSFGISEKVLKAMILIVDKEAGVDGKLDKGTKRGHILSVGYFINHPQRDEEGDDLFGINCSDSLRIAPQSVKQVRGKTVEIGGVTSESMEAVTIANPLGLRQEKITPGFFEVPKRFYHEDFTYPIGRKADSFFRMIPKQTYLVYEKGRLSGERVVESVRRDLLTFATALVDLEILSDMYLSKDGRKVLVKDTKRTTEIVNSIKDFSREFEGRRKSCLALFDEEADEQAKRVAIKKIGEIKDWLSNVDTRLGLKVSDYPSLK